MNIYQQKRKEAATFDKRFGSRAEAAELLPGVTEECLRNYEQGRSHVPEDVVKVMSEAYKAPELMAWYCRNECELGKKHNLSIPSPGLSVIRSKKAGCMLRSVLETMEDILDDGIVSDEEMEELPALEEELNETIIRLEEFVIVLKQLENGKSTAGSGVPLVLR